MIAVVTAAAATINGNLIQQGQRPAQHGDPHQLPLEDAREPWQQAELRDGFPGR